MTTNEIFEVIAANIREVEPELENARITPDDSMKVLGLPSVSRVEVLMLTMESLGVTVSNTELASARNIGEVVQIFEKHLNGQSGLRADA